MNLPLDQFDSLDESVEKNRLYPMLRELRRELLLEISGGENRIASFEEIKNWILDEYQNNPLVGDILRSILLINEDLLLSDNELPSLEVCKLSIRDAEKLPLPEFSFISSLFDGKPHGALIQREALKVGGFVYSISIFNRKNLTKKVSRIEIRVCSVESEPFASVLTLDGWVSVSKEKIHLVKLSVFALQCLIGCHRYIYPKLSTDSMIDPRTIKPRINNCLVELISSAYRDQVKCYKVKVPLTLISPRDLDYALTIHEEDIKSFITQINEFGSPLYELLLYEKDGELVMDDDYIPYLSYSAMQLEMVPAVILGEFKQDQVVVLSEGKSELVPPIGIAKINDALQVKRSKKDLLKEKLSSLAPKITDTEKLENKFIEFCRLLSNSSTLERELHNFLNENPQIIDSHVACIYSEVTIGRYRADLVLRYEQVDKKAVLIELERHSDKIFTKANRLRKKVTHASQQVEDWINEIRLNSKNIPNWLKNQYIPEGVVVIGRSSALTAEQKHLLTTINSNRVVKIITYDDLLERMKRLMKTLDRLQQKISQ